MVKSNSLKDVYAKAALELGYICMCWARLEHGVDELLRELAHIDEAEVANSIVANADIRSKIQIVQALAFILNTDTQWLNYCLGLLKYIDNDIRANRNLFIHAGWYVPRGRLVRRSFRTKLKRPQSHQLQLTTVDEVSVRLVELRKLKKDMEEAEFDLMIAFWYIMREPSANADMTLSFGDYVHAVGCDKRPRVRQFVGTRVRSLK